MPSSAELIKQLRAAGWSHLRTKGTHHQFEHPEHCHVITVVHPQKDVPIGTLKAILKAVKGKR